MATQPLRRMLGACQLREIANGACVMWILVNASYGIAMGQRPARTVEALRHQEYGSPARPAMLSCDPRLEAAQVRRREHLAQAAYEQWAERMASPHWSMSMFNALPAWAQAVWLRRRRVAAGGRSP